MVPGDRDRESAAAGRKKGKKEDMGKNGNCEYEAVRSDRLSGLWKDHGVIKSFWRD